MRPAFNHIASNQSSFHEEGPLDEGLVSIIDRDIILSFLANEDNENLPSPSRSR